MTADDCPHCLAPPRENGRPGCACAARAAAAARHPHPADTAPGAADRAARPAAAHPYVGPDDRRLGGARGAALFRTRSAGPAAGGWDGPDGPGGEPGAAAPGPASGHRPARRDPGPATGPDGERAAGAAPGAAFPAGRADPEPVPFGAGGPAGGPDAADAPADTGPAAETRARHRRSRPLVAVSAAAAVVALAGTLAFGTGLLGGDTGEDRGDRTLPDHRSPLPTRPVETWNGSMTPDGPPATTPAGPPAAASPATPSRGPAGSARPSPATSPAPSTASPDRPSPSAVETGPAGTPSQSPSPEPTGPPVLRPGDSGAEVVELQKRLKQTLTYLGGADGEYDEGVRNAVARYQRDHDVDGDPEGVYGPATRAVLESRTEEPAVDP